MNPREIQVRLSGLVSRAKSLHELTGSVASKFGPGTFVSELADNLEELERQAHLLGSMYSALRETVDPLRVKGVEA